LKKKVKLFDAFAAIGTGCPGAIVIGDHPAGIVAEIPKLSAAP